MDKQQIPVGYKQTEVGVIPADWSVSEIQEIARTGSGTTPARAQEDRYFKNGVSCWVKTLDLNNSVIRVTEEKVTELALKETCLQVYPKGTILVAMYGGFNQIGRTGLLDIPASVNQAIVAILVNANNDSRYLLDTLNYRVEYWKSVASSSRKDPNITSLDVKQFKLALPPTKQEQTAIANALSDVDALIAALEKLIDKKTTIKTATMQQLLTGKKRLPPFDQLDVGYKQTELGEIPKDWKLTKLGQVCTLVNGRGFKPYEWSDNGLPIIRIQNLNGSEEFNYFNGHYDPKLFIEHNQLLFAWSGSRGTSFGPHVWKGGNALLNYHTWKMVVDSTGIESNYFYHALKELTKMIEDSAHGASALVHTQKGEMEKLEFPIPRIREEQIAIANVFSDMDTELNALQQRLAKTQHIKQGMMQELLTGKTRLVTI